MHSSLEVLSREDSGGKPLITNPRILSTAKLVPGQWQTVVISNNIWGHAIPV